MNQSILIVDDEQNIRRSLSMILQSKGFSVTTADTLAEAYRHIKQPFHFFIIDVLLPDGDGIALIEPIRSAHPGSIIIVISGNANIKMAIEATRKGADDFLEKPLSRDKLLLTLRNFGKRLELEKKYHALQHQAGIDAFIGESAAIQAIHRTIEQIAPTSSKVLITGESGTGKEIVAWHIHHKSQRRDQPYIKVNCAAIPEELIEAELFGVEKGAYTGATERRDGKFTQADGGTLFLDEIGDMSLRTQTKVLRVLQDGEFERVGSNETLKTDVRIIAATNKNLQDAVARKEFREDLYFRLHVVPIHLPPLRERQADIPLLLDYFFDKFRHENNKPGLRMDDALIARLQQYDWPGNIRELKNLIERLVILADRPIIGPDQLPADMRTIPIDVHSAYNRQQSLFDFRDEVERRYIQFCLEQNNGNISKTARMLNVDRSYLHRKLKRFD